MPGLLPLKGITVVAVEQAVAAPFATRQLADLGARVIKIERVGSGDFARSYDNTVRGLSSHFVWLNRSKESLALDLKRVEARAILTRLLDRADVFVQNLAPGATERLGLGTAELRRTYPRLIVCAISGYGLSGPYRNKKAYDLLIQGETGFLSITGTPRVPAKAGIAIADIAGGMYAYSGILAALLLRQQTGEGRILDVSLFDSLGEWMGYAAYYAGYSGSSPKRTGSNHATVAPYGHFPTQGGDNIYLSVQNEREWKQFCEIVLQKPELATDARFRDNTRRVKNRPVLHRIIRSVLCQLPPQEVIGRLDKANIANGRMNTVQEFLSHPQLKARGRLCPIQSPVGSLWSFLPPVIMEGVQPVMQEIPDVGQHTGSILSELGFSTETIRGWQELGIISGSCGEDSALISEASSAH